MFTYRDTVQSAVQPGSPDSLPARRATVDIEMRFRIPSKFSGRGEPCIQKYL